MARPMQPIDEGLGGEIIEALKLVAEERGVLPNPHAFWEKILVGEKRCIISRGGFDYYWMRFQIAGLVTVDPITRAYKVKGIDLLVKD